MKRRLLDCFCGRFGLSKAFAARGWECVGIDLVRPPEIPQGCRFVQGDVLELDVNTAGEFILGEENLGTFAFLCASSPCEQFSVHGLKCFHPNPPYPELGMRLFEHTREVFEASGLPYLMENVRSAQSFIGQAAAHCGPFYLWGNAVPPLLHQGISKGTKFGLDKDGTRTSRKLNDMYYRTGSRSKGRTDHIAKVATIPPELANCVADYAERLLELDSVGLGMKQEGK